MAIEKLTEFAKDGQKNVDGLTETDGFPVLTKPARQWFNWLFNSITTKINEIIDQKIDFEDIIDNLTTNDATQPVSAKQAKVLQDNKLDKTSNAVSATKLATARTIGGVSFDGTANINLPGVNVAGNQSTSGNAATATKLATIRSLSFSGDASGTMSFDGSANVSTDLTLSNTGVVAGTYKSVTVDAKGRISAGNDVITGLVTATTATGTANQATSNTNTFLNITEKTGSATTTVGTSTQVTGAGTVSVTSDTTGKITITGAQSITGNAATATKLQTSRTIEISGAVTGTATGFDGSANIAIATTAIDGSKISSGTVPVARLPAASTSAAGTVQLNNTLTSTSNTQALTAAQGKVLNDQAFGVGQTWQDLTSSRNLNTIYTNNTGKPIQISVSVKDTASNYTSVVVEGVTVVLLSDMSGSIDGFQQVSAIVPKGATYSVNGGNVIVNWAELR